MKPEYQGYRTSSDADARDAFYGLAAEQYRNESGPGPMESFHQTMADDPLQRRLVTGALGVTGGAAMTAGAQKLIGLMGMLEEADETEVARDAPLTS